MERKLASVKRIDKITKHPNADSLEICHIGGWKVITRIGEYREGELAIYCEVDSFLPIDEKFEFLRKSSYKKMGEIEGFRLKTIRLRQELSQGLLLPLSTLRSEKEMVVGISKQPQGDKLQLGPYDDAIVIEEGLDVTDLLGIVKYEPPIPAQLAGKVKGNFPGFIRKTEEERIQNLANRLDELRKHTYYVTEKLDGSSATYYFRDGFFGVCSRNLELSDPGEFVPDTVVGEDGVTREKKENSFWKVAKDLRIKEKLELSGGNYSIQGELIGEGIQGNPYKIKGHTLRVFNIFNIDTQEYLGLDEMREFLSKVNNDDKPLELVPVLEENYSLPETVDEILLYAEGKSKLYNGAEREGVVIRNKDKTISFKSISNSFLLKEK